MVHGAAYCGTCIQCFLTGAVVSVCLRLVCRVGCAIELASHVDLGEGCDRHVVHGQSVLSMERGYSVLMIEVFYECDVTQSDLQTVDGVNFVQYVDMFLKFKFEASGYPRLVQVPEDDMYVMYFRES